MAERTNPQAEIIVGARDDASPSFDAIKRNAQKMGEAVEQSAQKAGDSMGKLGGNAAPSAQKVDNATKSIIASIERATAAMKAGEKGSADYFAELAKQRGVSADLIKPYVDELRRAQDAQRIAAGSLDKMGVSAKQTTAALRQVPMQFTDIIVSLQGGQKPMQVLLQQGSQLKDIFGGIGPAAQALGGYVLGLVNPLTLTAAALAAIGVAYYQGSKESDAYAKSLLLTGNAAGTTASQLQQMAANVSSAIGTQAAAADALAQMAGTGRVAAGDLERFTETAVRMERDVGVAVKDTVSAFAELGKSPVEASKKLNDQHNYLTASIYSQIKALEQQGNATGAAQLAQETYDKAMQRVAAGMQDRLGYLEKAWRGVGSAAKWAWDQVANVGRPDTLADQIANVQQKILQGQGLDKNRPGGLMPWEPSLNDYKAQLADLQERQRMEQKLARTTSERAAANKAATEAMDAVDKLTESAASKQEKLNKALEDYRRSLEKIRAADPNDKRLDPSAIAKVEAYISDQYKDKSVKTSTGQSELDSIRAKITLEDEYIARLKQQGTAAEKANEGERLAAKLNQELSGTLDAKTRAQKESLLVAANTLAARQSERSEIERQAKAAEEAEKAYRKYIDGLQKTSDSIGQQADQQETANATYGKSKTAIAELTLAQMKLRLETEKNAGPWDPAAIAAMKEAVSQQERLVKSLHDADYNKATDSLKESIALSGDQLALTKQDLSLLGISDLERKKIVATRKIEIDLAKKLREIDKQTYSSNADENAARKEELRQQARKDASIKAEEAIASVTLSEWQKTADQINQSLTDALLRGFESGKDFAKNLRDTVVNMFKTMVLKPVIQMVLNPISMGLAGILGGGSAMAGQGGAGSLLGLASNASSLMNLGGMGSFLGAGSFGGMISNVGAGIAHGFSTLISDGIGAALSQGTGLIGAGSTGGGIGALLGGAALPALGVGLLLNGLGLFRKTEKRGEALTGTLGAAGSIQSADLMRRSGTLFGGPDWFLQNRAASPLDAGIQKTFAASLASIGKFADALGLASDKVHGFTTTLGTDKLGDHGDIGLRLDNDGKPLSDQEIQAKIAEAIKTANNELAQQILYGAGSFDSMNSSVLLDRVAQGQATVTPDFARDGEQAIDTITRLGTSIVATNEVFKTLGLTLFDGSLAGADLASQLIDATGGMEAFASKTGSYFQNYYSQIEQQGAAYSALTDQFAELNLAVPASRAELRALVESLDLTTEAGRTAFGSLMSLQDGFAGMVSAAQEATGLTVDSVKSLFSSVLEQASSAAEAQQMAADQFSTMFADSIMNMMIGNVSDMLMNSVIAPLLDSVMLGSITAGEALTMGAATSAAVLAEGGAMAGGANFAGGAAAAGAMAAGGSSAAGSMASGGASAGASMAGGGAAAGGRIDAAIASVNSYLAAMTAVMKDPSVQSAIKEVSGIVGSTAGQLYRSGSSFGASVGGAVSQSPAQKAKDAADKLAESLKKLGETMMDEVMRIRGLVAEDASHGMAYWQSQFTIDTAKARAGDADAAAGLVNMSRSLLGVAKDEAGSMLELQRMRAWVAQSLQDTSILMQKPGSALPQPPQTVVVPQAGVAPQYTTPVVMADPGTKEELRELREQNRAQAAQILQLQLRIARSLESLDDRQRAWNLGTPLHVREVPA